MSILVVGSVALDTIETPSGFRKDLLGGSATYFSISASFFSPVNLVAVVGRDFSLKYIDLFKKRKIDINGLEIKDGETFRWEAKYNTDLNNVKTISTKLNVFSDFKPNIPDNYILSDYVFLANIDPQLQEFVLEKIKKPKLIASDTMSHWIIEKKKALIKLLKKIDIFFLNETEARLLSEENNLYKAAKSILKFGPKNVIIKKGENGALLFSTNSIFSVPAFLLENVIDPTGAGDTFAGGVIGYLSNSKDKDLKKAILYGTVLASFAVEDFSINRLINIKFSDIQKRLNAFKKIINYGL